MEGVEQPLQVHKDKRNPALFLVGDYIYDIDGRAMGSQGPSVPRILMVHSLQSAREIGLKVNVDMGAAYPDAREFVSQRVIY